MPKWDYQCPRCGLVEEVTAPSHLAAIMAEPRVCSRCDRDETLCGDRMMMQRLPPGANFTVKGYSAKNGYSGKGEKK